MKAETKIKATAWRVPTEDQDGYTYRVQVDGIFGKRIQNRVVKSFEDWKPAGSAYRPENKETTLIYTQTFESKEDFLEWARSFPYSLVEGTNRGSYKKIKTAVNKRD